MVFFRNFHQFLAKFPFRKIDLFTRKRYYLLMRWFFLPHQSFKIFQFQFYPSILLTRVRNRQTYMRVHIFKTSWIFIFLINTYERQYLNKTMMMRSLLISWSRYFSTKIFSNAFPKYIYFYRYYEICTYIYHVSNLIILILIKVYMHVKHNEFFLLYFMSLQSYNLKTEKKQWKNFRSEWERKRIHLFIFKTQFR